MKPMYVACLALAALAGACNPPAPAIKPIPVEKETAKNRDFTSKKDQLAITPQNVVEALKVGNARFVAGKSLNHDYLFQKDSTANGQNPHAVILSCIDSRIPVEVIFDQGIGDLFVARVAGNFVNTDILGSMEFGCKAVGAKTIVVMGHTNCGAIKGAIDDVKLAPNLTSALQNIKPAVQKEINAVGGEDNSHNHELVEMVSKENVMQTMQNIRAKSALLKQMEAEQKINIVGAMYDLSTGKVTFY
jgi:carbonic anhydrase